MARSSIAAINTEFRALETEKGFILKDPFARHFVDQNLRLSLMRLAWRRSAAFRRWTDRFQTVHCIRHRAVDGLLERELSDDRPRNVLILGAGYDMRAFRYERAGVNWTEVDSEETLARKATILKTKSLTDHVRRLPADLNRVPLEEILMRLDTRLPTVVIAEGLVHYLDPAVVSGWLRALGFASGWSHQEHVLIGSYIPTRMLERADFVLKRVFNLFRENPVKSYTAEEWRTLGTANGAIEFEDYPVERQIAEFCPRASEREIGVSQDVFTMRWPSGAARKS